jgi:hypothetical protein
VPPPPRIQAGKILRHGDEQTASQYPLNDARSVTISSSFLAGADEVIEYSISGRLAAVPLGRGFELAPFRRQNPRAEPGAISSAFCAGGRRVDLRDRTCARHEALIAGVDEV